MRSTHDCRTSLCLCCLLSSTLIACSLFMPTAAGSAPTSAATAEPSSQPDQATKERAFASYVKLPLSFEVNRGQTDAQVKFLSQGSDYTLFLTGDGAVLSLQNQQANFDGRNPVLPGGNATVAAATRHAKSANSDAATSAASVVRMKLVGANPGAEVSGLEELPGKSNYFIANDPKQWRTDVPNYAKVKYRAVYPGIDLVYYGNQRQLEYDFVVAPGADPKAITLNIGPDSTPARRGHRQIASLRIDATGDLLVRLNGGDIRFHKPVVYQPASNSGLSTPDKRFVDGRYRLSGRNQVSFEIASYDRAKPLVIDPVLTYSSLISGSGGAWGRGIAVDGSGNVYLTGYAGRNFPRVNQIPDACKGGCNSGGVEVAFVTKINAAGSALVYSDVIGGSDGTYGAGIAVDSFGNAYLLGTTASTDFPQVNQIQVACQGTCGKGTANDVYVTAINAGGNALIYSDLIGGSGTDEGFGIAADYLGNAYITGITDSQDFPMVNEIPGACQGGCVNGGQNAFVVKINVGGGGLVYSSYLGGSAEDEGISIAADESGNAYLTGFTASTDFPRVNQISGACRNSCDNGNGHPAFVTKINAEGTALVYSSYLGGSGDSPGYGIAVDGSGNVYVTGRAGSGFPQVNQIPGACRGTCGGTDVFVTKIDAAGDALVYSSLVGGSLDDIGYSVAVDALGNAYLTGTTASKDFPQVNPIPGACQGNCGKGGAYDFDAFVTKIDAAGDALVYSSYLGGSNTDTAYGIAVDGLGNADLTGITKSIDFPTVNQIPGACPDPCNPGVGVAFATQVSSGGAAVDLSPASLDFGSQGLTQVNTPQSVLLTNVGDASLIISMIAVTGTNSADFVEWDNCPRLGGGLPPGQSCTITVAFEPTGIGTRTAAVTISDNAPDSPQMVPLTGIGVGGKVKLK